MSADQGREQDLTSLLHDGLAGAGEEFDHDALLRGAFERADHLRRRRRTQIGAVAAVALPAAVAAGLLLPVTVQEQAPVLPASTSAASSSDDAPSSAPATATAEDARSEDAAASTPPFQDGELPLPEGGIETGAVANRAELPDPRPTGVAFLDDLGAPQDYTLYPRIVPLQGWMAGNDLANASGAEPHSGATWTYWDVAGGGDPGVPSVDINLSLFDDGPSAMRQLRAGEASATWYPTVPDYASWPEHEGDTDYLLVEDDQPAASGQSAGAVVRVGDYLLGVNVVASTDAEARDAVIEIAEKSAANLAATSPQDGTG